MATSGHIMNKNLGIWIDHKEAVLVAMDGDRATVERIESNAESHFRPTGGWRSNGTSVAQAVSKERSATERRKHQLHGFYQQVIKKASQTGKIYIFGPGAAKGELAREMGKTDQGRDRIVAVETSDKMTENQIVAKVKTFF